MAEYRYVQTSFWTDAFVLRLTPEEKYFYLYLMTNPKTTQCGAYELPFQVVIFETGYNLETVTKLIAKFAEYGKVHYDADTQEIILLNWLFNNWVDSEKVIYRVIKDAQLLKSLVIKEHLNRVLIGYGYRIDMVPNKGKEIKEKEKKGKESKSTNLPDDFVVSHDLKHWAHELGLPDSVIETETAKFRDYHVAKGSTFKNWDASWRTWMRNAKEWRKPTKQPTASREFPRP